MNQFVPKLFDCMKGYSKEQFVKDVIAGIIVAIIALPLSIALALASGVGPEQGIYTAIFAGFVISFLGGSRVQIAGPTAAFATIVAGIVAEHQMEGYYCHNSCRNYSYYNGTFKVRKFNPLHSVYDYIGLYLWYCRNDCYRTGQGLFGTDIYIFTGGNHRQG